ncbi:DEAD/DEAH box helicase [Candidatus Poriferisodalis sp.]|uniref:DEAD/DEAH box helicase n=1 Tax=Candidatus Poriferisodalis sp. TaxID=3101277 RepID=UPI003AF5AC8A
MTDDGFVGLNLGKRYNTLDDPLNTFYVPVLERATSYDRVAGYFSSSSFVSAAAGLARFINNSGTIRLLVGSQLSEADRDALLGQAPLTDVLAHSLNDDLDRSVSADEIARQRLGVIAWLVQQGRLQIRVGVPCDPSGVPLAGSDAGQRYFHSKFGVLADDAANRVAFTGSINESAAGWQRNFESFNVYRSWRAESWADYGEPLSQEFEELWSGQPPPGGGSSGNQTGVAAWRTVLLPQAVRDRLLQLVSPGWTPPPRDPLEPSPSLTPSELEHLAAIRTAPSTCTGVGLVSAAVEPWPHQLAISRRICETWPRSYLLADEVGLGKTIETGLVLRELLLSGRLSTALLLVPASVLIQWQEELSEKFLLDIPRLDSGDLVWADGRRHKAAASGESAWRSAPVLLASSHLARRREHRAALTEGTAWDLVFVDEAHHARRRGTKASDSPNQMLATLLAMKRASTWNVLLLASATPMQMNTHDIWDLLLLFGLPSPWSESPEHMERYFGEFGAEFADRKWTFLRQMLAGHFAAANAEPALVDEMTGALGLVAAKRITEFHKRPYTKGSTRDLGKEQKSWWDTWLRANTPVRDRVFRTTRATLRTYQEQGVLPEGTVVPERRVTHESCELGESAEALYGRIDSYIKRHYDAYLADRGRRRPLGFIMTVYRRRLTSSFHAVRCSLERRREVLRGQRHLQAFVDDDDVASSEESNALAANGLAVAQTASGGAGVDPAWDPEIAGAEWDDAVTATASEYLAEELAELDSFIDELNDLPPDEPKTRRLYELLESSFAGGHRSVVVFTQYADTLCYLRERLRVIYGTGIVCYFGGRGERWDPDAGEWAVLPKERVKELFRQGDDVRIMLGTDSMSEGLNLQTCARVINYDLPWNFMRVEQRIGRVDRIGGQPRVEVTNLSYKGTVEDDILRRIEDRLHWFTTVVGNAQPVLASMESAMQRAALGQITPDGAVLEVEQMNRQAMASPVKLADLDAVPRHARPLQPAMDLSGLRDALLKITLCAERLSQHPDIDGAWLLHLDGSVHGVTFDRARVQQVDGLSLLTWGSPLLDRLLDTAQSTTGEL